jgi:undecaprenyl-diphosphatase
MTQKTNDNNGRTSYNPFWKIKYSYILILLTIFVIITLLTTNGVTKNVDNYIINYFMNIPRNAQSDIIIITVTTLADTINLIIIGFILTIIKRTRPFGLILLISIVAITILVTYLKPFFGVNQTQFIFKPLVKLPNKFTLEKDSFMPFDQNYSYPSNHLASTTAFSFIIGGLIYNRFPKIAKCFIILFPALIGITKLYLLQQFVSDILGGCILGLVITILIIKFTKIKREQ